MLHETAKKVASAKLTQTLSLVVISILLFCYAFMDRYLIEQRLEELAFHPDQVLIPDDTRLDKLSLFEQVDLYVRYTNSFQTLCRNHKRMGQLTDGGKEMCFDQDIRPKAPCLVYSLGSYNQFDFEKDIIRHFSCETHTFDPNMLHLYPNQIKKPPINSYFHHMGVNGMEKQRKRLNYTLDKIRTMLNHTGRVIDILKIDIEGDEFRALDQMVRAGTLSFVRQLLVEFHFTQNETPHNHGENVFRLGVLRSLYNAGFRSFSRERNLCRNCIKNVKQLDYPFSLLVEMSFINIKYVSK